MQRRMNQRPTGSKRAIFARVLGLFRPYRGRFAVLLVLIAGGAVLDLLSLEWSESYTPHDAGAAAAAIGRFLRRDRDAMAAAAAHAGATVVGDSDAHFKRLFATYARLVDEHAARR